MDNGTIFSRRELKSKIGGSLMVGAYRYKWFAADFPALWHHSFSYMKLLQTARMSCCKQYVPLSPCRYWPFFMQISGRKFLPELCGEVHPKTASLQALCCAFSLQNRALFEEQKKKAKACRERGGRGVAKKGGKKEKRRVKTGQVKSLFWKDMISCHFRSAKVRRSRWKAKLSRDSARITDLDVLTSICPSFCLSALHDISGTDKGGFSFVFHTLGGL